MKARAEARQGHGFAGNAGWHGPASGVIEASYFFSWLRFGAAPNLAKRRPRQPSAARMRQPNMGLNTGFSAKPWEWPIKRRPSFATRGKGQFRRLRSCAPLRAPG